MALNQKPTHNHLLAALSPAVQLRIFPHLELVKRQLYAPLYDVHRPLLHVYFPSSLVVSLHYLLEDGSSTALAIAGNEGLVGINWIFIEESTDFEARVQHAGFAYRLPKSIMKEEFNRHGEFMFLTLRYTQALMKQVSQTAVCNRHHSIAQQLCRWLLMSMDCVSSANLTMTQEFICHMLGVRREGVSEAATILQQLGVISYSRGKINVIDRQKLEALACECYRVVRTKTDQLLDYLPQHQ